MLAVPNGETTQEVKVLIDTRSLDELTKLWSALGTPLVPSIGITVSNAAYIAPKQPETPVTATLAPSSTDEKVSELYQAVQKTFTEQYTSWKKSNMFRKQLIMQYFKSNTEMDAAEMQDILDELGEKIQTRQTKTEFIQPLEGLVKFYKFQQNELKGMSRFSPKQKENVNIVEGWIREVNALIEALQQTS
jgi:hypothetical protein